MMNLVTANATSGLLIYGGVALLLVSEYVRRKGERQAKVRLSRIGRLLEIVALAMVVMGGIVIFAYAETYTTERHTVRSAFGRMVPTPAV